MAEKTKNIAASVHQRLLNKAREASRPFNELLQHFAIERFIYRLSKSPHADRFVLKGALMFSAWTGSMSRPTMDIDLLGKIRNSLESIVAVVKDACEIKVENDGIVFHKDTVSAARITEDADYKGIRVLVRGNLGSTRLFLQVDIGFGDVIIPGPSKVKYPVLLDFPPPELDGYTMESTVAEKFQAMMKLGLLNSRMKDFYDIWFLSRNFDFKWETLIEAIEKTFEKTKTPVISEPTIFNPSFMKDENKQAQWQGFINKAKLGDAPASFENLAARIKFFLQPVVVSIIDRQTFRLFWAAPGPWRT
ncbi:MAG: nucleotidyl transferase AbiEii/AbiGii toxin family protein [Deltaproteobacteria bacterium]|nr:nucleotidyl transferase AbiEii/AbiGii toxin family protein [Deltaproteobacteria bacterium]